MNKLLVGAVLSCLALQGQSLNWSKVQGYAGGGFSSPMGGFGARHDMGWNVLVGGGARITPLISLNLEYSFNKFDYNHTVFFPPTVSLATYKGGSEIHGFTFNPRIHTPPVWKIGTYVTGGYGVYDTKFQLARPVPNPTGTVLCDPAWSQCSPYAVVPTGWALGQTSTWKGGWNAGLGLEGGDRIKFFAEARYVYIFTHNIRTEFIPVTFGVHF